MIMLNVIAGGQKKISPFCIFIAFVGDPYEFTAVFVADFDSKIVEGL